MAGWVMKGLKRLQAGGILLREVRGIRKALERIADGIDRVSPPAVSVGPRRGEAEDVGPVLITQVDSVLSQELAEIELELTRTKGIPPTEEEILRVYSANHHDADDPRRLSNLDPHWTDTHGQ